MITLEQLKNIVPNLPVNADVFIKHLNDTMAKYNINTKPRIAAFIAQLAHESGGFRYTKEIASGQAYEGRVDLGNTFKGDGKRYKGRGFIQITGRNNYQKVGKALGVDLITHPELLESPQYACLSAGYMWELIKGNGLSDLPDDWRSKTHGYSPFQYITYRVNGGQNGLADRMEYYKRALEVIP